MVNTDLQRIIHIKYYCEEIKQDRIILNDAVLFDWYEF